MKQRAGVLVIEDEAPIRTFIRRALEPAYQVYESAGGADGLKQARWVLPDIILLDLRMPGLDGLTVLAKLKADPKTARIPIVIVSGRGETDLLIEGQKMGALDHVIKPFTVEELLGVIQKQLALHSAEPPANTEEPGTL